MNHCVGSQRGDKSECISVFAHKELTNMKMNNMSRPKKTATLSMVLSMTTRDLWRFGRNLTSLMILNSRNVLRTERPRPPSP